MLRNWRKRTTYRVLIVLKTITWDFMILFMMRHYDIKIQQLEGVVLIAGVADETNYPKFKVSVPPNIMKRNETVLHYTTIPNMKLSILDLRPLSNFLPEV